MSSRALIYCRLSQDRAGAGVVVARQERDCRELAAEKGWTVVAVFVDNDVSAYRKKRRPGYEALLAALEADQGDLVIVWHTDRLLRSPKELEQYIDLCNPRGITTETVRAGQLDLSTPAGRLAARNHGAAARYESEQTAGRVTAGKAEAAMLGVWSGGGRPYGYDFIPLERRGDNGTALRINPREAEVVRSAGTRVLAGESLRSIARSLNERGVLTTHGNLWNGSALRKVLVRPTTAGLRMRKGEVLGSGGWEPLIPEDRWRGIVAVLTDPARRTTDRHARVYLGSGMYLCGVCGGKLTGNSTASGAHGARRAAYRCRNADRDGGSHVVRVVDHLDAFVTGVVIARLGQLDARAATAPPSLDTASLHAEAEGLRARLDEAASKWAAETLTQSQLVTATKELRRRLDEVDQRIGQANKGSVLSGLAGTTDVANAWGGLSLERRRAIIDVLASVTVLPRQGGRVAGGSYFDPLSVRIDWKQA